MNMAHVEEHRIEISEMLKNSNFHSSDEQLLIDAERAGVLIHISSIPTPEQLAERSKKDYRNLIESIYK